MDVRGPGHDPGSAPAGAKQTSDCGRFKTRSRLSRTMLTLPVGKLPPRIELSSLAREQHPYSTYDRLRLASAVTRAGPNQWLVTRYREVAALLADPSLRQFQISAVLQNRAEGAVLSTPAVEFTQRILAGRDGEDHAQLRRCMSRAMKAATPGLDHVINTELDAIVREVRERGSFDVVKDVASVLPIRVLGRIVGIPTSLQGGVARRSLELAHVFAPDYEAKDRAETSSAVVWLRECIRELLQDTQKQGASSQETGTFIAQFSALCAGHWSQCDVIDNIVFFLFAGFETSLNLIANGFDALLDFADQQRRLRDDPSLSASAVEEFMRYRSPVHITGRVTTQPMHIDGQRIGAGRVIYLGLAAANRDPQEFHDPARLDIGRSPNRHVAFANGAHHCIGATIARREATLLFERFAREIGWLEKQAEPTRVDSATLRSIVRLDVRVVG